MENKLRAFFKSEIIEKIADEIEIEEKNEGANPCKITLKGKNLILLKKELLGGTVSEIFEKKPYNLRKISDGIVIDVENQTVYIFELKTTIYMAEVENSLQQIAATYLKVVMLLSCFLKVEMMRKLKIEVIVVGNISKRIEDKSLALKNGNNQAFLLLEKMYRNQAYLFPKFPENIYQEISDLYQKQNVLLTYKTPNQTINI